jgi:hypothetical protein
MLDEQFMLESFPFDQQTVRMPIRLPKANAKDAHFTFYVSDNLNVEKEKIRAKKKAPSDNPNERRSVVVLAEEGTGALEMTRNVTDFLQQQWTILESDLRVVTMTEVRLKIKLQRKHEYYLTRMIAPSGVCASLSMTAWNVEHHAFGERAQIVVTLFLALVASNTAYAGSLPKLPYLTVLDRRPPAALPHIQLPHAPKAIITTTTASNHLIHT